MRSVFPKVPFFRTTAARADVALTVRLPQRGLPAHPTARPVSSQLVYTTFIGSLPGHGELRAAVALASRRRHCAQPPPPPFQPLPALVRGRTQLLSSLLLIIFLDNRVSVSYVASTSRTPASHHPLQR